MSIDQSKDEIYFSERVAFTDNVISEDMPFTEQFHLDEGRAGKTPS